MRLVLDTSSLVTLEIVGLLEREGGVLEVLIERYLREIGK